MKRYFKYFHLLLETTSNVVSFLCIYIDVQCTLAAPSNGEITSCSSGSIGLGYGGDTCSFSCNTGYELTGSDTRTCQSDGSWSGSDAVCRRSKYYVVCCLHLIMHHLLYSPLSIT